MKKLFYYLAVVVLVGFVSCSDDDDDNPVYNPTLPEVSIVNLSGEDASVIQEDTLYLKANVKSQLRSKFVWSVSGLKSATPSVTDSVFKFVQKEPGNYVVTLTCINPDGEASVDLDVRVHGKYYNGTFVLNEGSVFQENSKLTFISPKGIVTDSAFWKVNGTELGNASQDLFIANDKIYIVAQNGKSNIGKYPNEGKLVIANAETLEKQASFNDEISVLSWPTHVAVLNDNNAFIRDNKGVYLFNPLTKEIKFIEGSNGALKNRMAVVNNKVFVPASNSVLVLETGKTTVSKKIEFEAKVSGVIKTADGNVYVSTTGSPNKITKISAKDYSVIKENEVTVGALGAGWGATPGIAGGGDVIYYNNAGITIYRHTFSTGISEKLVTASDFIEDAGMAYNNLGVNTLTGDVYLTTIKGYGNAFLINSISVFDFSKEKPSLKENYKDYTHFPAGTYFTYDFR